jgi:PKD repeat protein
MQPADDEDFELEVKFDSPVTAPQYQIQGIVIEQDNDDFLRFDFHSTDTKTRIFAASFVDGNGTSQVSGVDIADLNVASLYMRVKRAGDVWTQSYSLDGTTWLTPSGGTFTHVMTVTAVGLFVGNSGNNPAHTAQADYFFNTASPLDPEDGGLLTVNTVGDGTVTPLGPVNSCGEVELTAVPGASASFSGWSGDLIGSTNPATLTVLGGQVVTATFMSGGTSPTPPIASFTANPTVGEAPLTVNFDASSSSDPGGTIVIYEWDFGDGSTGTGITYTHEYTTSGIFPITLTVTDDGGATDTAQTIILVDQPPIAPSITSPPTDQSVIEGQAATFSVVAEGTEPLSYQWQRDGVDLAGATGPSYTTPATTLADDGAIFRVVVSNTVGSMTSVEATLTVTASQGRVTAGQQVLYTFEEGSGSTVQDVSGVSAALNLSIENPAAVSWMAGGLVVNGSTLIASAGAATKVIDNAKASNEITLEAWLKPATTEQDGPARIVALSQDSSNRNFTLGQGLWGSQPSDLYDVRLRTTTTDSNGRPSLTTSAGTLSTQLNHVVYTHNASGVTKIYIDGVEQVGGTVAGDLSNWNSSYRLGLANELTGDRPWLGELHLVAIYDRALSQAEVSQNFVAGPDGT